MKVLMGTSLALLLAAATPVLAAPGDQIGSQGAREYAQDTSAGTSTGPQATPSEGERADRGDRASRRADREARRAERAERRAQRGDRGDRAERRAQRGERGDRGGRAGRQSKRQFAQGDRVPRKFLAGRRLVTDYARYGVQRPSGGDQWVRGRHQLLLVSADGVVKTVVARQKRRGDRAERRGDRGADTQAPAPDDSDTY